MCVCVCVCVCVYVCACVYVFISFHRKGFSWLSNTINVMPEIRPAMLPWGNISLSRTFVARHRQSYQGPRYGVSLHIQSKCRKIQTRKTPNTDTFHAPSLAVNLLFFFFFAKTSICLWPSRHWNKTENNAITFLSGWLIVYKVV